jgi:hypothetical protein
MGESSTHGDHKSNCETKKDRGFHGVTPDSSSWIEGGVRARGDAQKLQAM